MNEAGLQHEKGVASTIAKLGMEGMLAVKKSRLIVSVFLMNFSLIFFSLIYIFPLSGSLWNHL